MKVCLLQFVLLSLVSGKLIASTYPSCESEYADLTSLCPIGTVQSPSRPHVCYVPIRAPISDARWDFRTAMQRCESIWSQFAPYSKANGSRLASAEDSVEWGAMEDAAAGQTPDLAPTRYWLGWQFNEPLAGLDKLKSLVWYGQENRSVDFARSLDSLPRWTSSFCDCVWEEGFPCTAASPACVSYTNENRRCVLMHRADCPAGGGECPAEPGSSGPVRGRWVLRNEVCDVGQENVNSQAAMCEMHLSEVPSAGATRANRPPRIVGASSGGSRGNASSPAPPLPSEGGRDGAPFYLDVPVGHLQARGSVVASFRVEDSDPLGLPAGSPLLMVEPNPWVYADSERMALLFAGANASLSPPPLGWISPVRVWARDGLGCESEAVTVRVRVLPSHPLGPWTKCPPSTGVAWFNVGSKCYARGQAGISLDHPWQTGLAWPVTRSKGCSALAQGARLARAPPVVRRLKRDGNFALTYSTWQMQRMDAACASRTGPAWVAAYLTQPGAAGTVSPQCPWRWSELETGPKQPVCSSWLQSDALMGPKDDIVSASLNASTACMALEFRALPGGVEFDNPELVRPRLTPTGCAAVIPPCCELALSHSGFGPNSLPAFTMSRVPVTTVFIFQLDNETYTSQPSVRHDVIDRDGDDCHSDEPCPAADMDIQVLHSSGSGARLELEFDSRFGDHLCITRGMCLRAKWAPSSELAATARGPSRSAYARMRVRACDALGACTDSALASSPEWRGVVGADLDFAMVGLVCSVGCGAGEREVSPCRIPYKRSLGVGTIPVFDVSVTDASELVSNTLCVPWHALAFGDAPSPLWARKLALPSRAPAAAISQAVLAAGAAWAFALLCASALLLWRARSCFTADHGKTTSSASSLENAATSDAPGLTSSGEVAQVTSPMAASAVASTVAGSAESDGSPAGGEGGKPNVKASNVIGSSRIDGCDGTTDQHTLLQAPIGLVRWLQADATRAGLGLCTKATAGASAFIFVLTSAAIAAYLPRDFARPDFSLPEHMSQLRPPGTAWTSELLPPITAEHLRTMVAGLPATILRPDAQIARVPEEWAWAMLWVALTMALAVRLGLSLLSAWHLSRNATAQLQRITGGPGFVAEQIQKADWAAGRGDRKPALAGLRRALQAYAAVVRAAPLSALLALASPSALCEEAIMHAAALASLSEEPSSAAGDERQAAGADANHRFAASQAVRACRRGIRRDVSSLGAPADLLLLAAAAFAVSPYQAAAWDGAWAVACVCAGVAQLLLYFAAALLPWGFVHGVLPAFLQPAAFPPADSAAVALEDKAMTASGGISALLRVAAPRTYERWVVAHVQAEAMMRKARGGAAEGAHAATRASGGADDEEDVAPVTDAASSLRVLNHAFGVHSAAPTSGKDRGALGERSEGSGATVNPVGTLQARNSRVGTMRDRLPEASSRGEREVASASAVPIHNLEAAQSPASRDESAGESVGAGGGTVKFATSFERAPAQGPDASRAASGAGVPSTAAAAEGASPSAAARGSATGSGGSGEGEGTVKFALSYETHVHRTDK